LPLGSDAFMPPLAPTAQSAETDRPRWVAPVVAIAASAALGAVIALTFLLRRDAPEIAPEPVAAMPTSQAAAASEPPRTGAALAPAAAPAVARPARVAVPAPTAAQAQASDPAPAVAEPEADTERRTGKTRRDRSRRSSRAKQALPDKLSRPQVIAAMTRVKRQIQACFPSGRGSLTADVKVIGRTGRVSTAQINGQSGAIGSCAARAVRKAKFPKFSEESLTFTYPMAF
jgi:hypothetical protein